MDRSGGILPGRKKNSHFRTERSLSLLFPYFFMSCSVLKLQNLPILKLKDIFSLKLMMVNHAKDGTAYIVQG